MDASALLNQIDSARSKLPSILVDRPLEPDVIDENNLLLVDTNDLDELSRANQPKREQQLKKLARDNAQLLLNRLWQLPTKLVEDVTVAELPPPTFTLPREKPLPKAKPMTKWEKYAKEKGIKNKKKTKLIWDDVVNRWVPRFGYKKAQAEDEKNWMMEIKDNADPMEDPFEKAKEAKRERVAKNELQRLRNLARAKNVKVPGVGVAPKPPKDSQSSDTLKKAAALAHTSTASLGKFQAKLTGKLEKSAAASKPQGKKRQFDPLVSAGEKEKNLKILGQMSSKRAKLDVNKAVGKAIGAEQAERAEEKKKGKGGGRGGKNKKNKAAKKSAAGGKGGGKQFAAKGGKGGTGKKGGGKRR